jgi:hypothetical protein
MPKKYTEDYLMKAISAVKKKQFKIPKTAKEFNIARRTISDYVKNPDITSSKGPRETANKRRGRWAGQLCALQSWTKFPTHNKDGYMLRAVNYWTVRYVNYFKPSGIN